MSDVKVVWATPDIDNPLAFIARVSNPDNQDNPNIKGLLTYMMTHGHVSPFEMANVCLELNTTRDIGRQILRHRSFAFQEFSQRYAEVNQFETGECRLQDTKNRQNSLLNEDRELADVWEKGQQQLIQDSTQLYQWALNNGIAKEVARKVLPEGLTGSRMYMTGTLRSWIHYLQVRLDPSTQKEHREVAEKILVALQKDFPNILEVTK